MAHEHEPWVTFSGVTFVYPAHGEGKQPVKALSGVSVTVDKGSFTVILGRNGSGKSTFARHINALLLPLEGTVAVCRRDTRDAALVWDIRKSSGMVFQNPDNGIVGTTVEEDVAFGPENLGVPPADIARRVEDALVAVGMEAYRDHAPHHLSGGQKQRVAVAGVLAMAPDCIILDESTAMLDPVGRREVLTVMKRLCREQGITVILITHFMEEAVEADRVLVVHQGNVVKDGTPETVFRDVEDIRAMGLDVPQTADLFWRLQQLGWPLPSGVMREEDALETLTQVMQAMAGHGNHTEGGSHGG